LAIRTGIADGKVIRPKIPGLTAIFQVLNDPCLDILRSVHSQYIKMGVSIVKGIVLRFPAIWSILWIGALKLSAKKLRRLRIIPAYVIAVMI